MVKKNYNDMLILFIQYQRVTDKQTDGQNCYVNIARQCADARDKYERKERRALEFIEPRARRAEKCDY